MIFDKNNLLAARIRVAIDATNPHPSSCFDDYCHDAFARRDVVVVSRWNTTAAASVRHGAPQIILQRPGWKPKPLGPRSDRYLSPGDLCCRIWNALWEENCQTVITTNRPPFAFATVTLQAEQGTYKGKPAYKWTAEANGKTRSGYSKSATEMASAVLEFADSVLPTG